MIVIIGFIVVIVGVLGGFSIAGCHAEAFWHPYEIITIGGASLGSLIVMSSKKTLVDLFIGVMQAVKGSPFNRKMYNELFSLM